MNKIITADDLEWRSSHSRDYAYIVGHYIVRRPNETYVIYQRYVRTGIFYSLDEVLIVLNHDQKEEV